MSDKEARQLKAEIDIMAKLDHKNIVKLIEAYDTEKKTYLILELYVIIVLLILGFPVGSFLML